MPSGVSQGSALAAAIRYGLRHWEGLCRFLDDGTLELDTNSVEREIRPVVVTRKAALFAEIEGPPLPAAVRAPRASR